MDEPFPKPTEESLAYFESLVPDDSRVQSKPMFGNRAAFVNGNMFLALFGGQVAVRLPDEDRATLLLQKGTSEFEPMPGRPMKEYVALPAGWNEEKAREWVERSLAWALQLPPRKEARNTRLIRSPKSPSPPM